MYYDTLFNLSVYTGYMLNQIGVKRYVNMVNKHISNYVVFNTYMNRIRK